MKNFRYQSINQAFQIAQLSITIDIFTLKPKDGKRIYVSASGFQWFIYNKMPIYEYYEALIKSLNSDKISGNVFETSVYVL